jgi:lysylphosphatidylglycerol synthetase-like protein (DUF2156 family)
MLVYYILPDKGIAFFPLNLVLAVLIPVVLIGLSSFLAIRGILRKTASMAWILSIPIYRGCARTVGSLRVPNLARQG